MPGANGLMAASFASQSLNSFGSGYGQSQAIAAQTDYKSSALEMNAKLADIRSKDAIERGYVDAGAAAKKASQVGGAQRVALAAQGIDVNSGDSADVQAQTRRDAQIDDITIRNNAWREAFGYRVEAQDYRNQAEMTRIGGNFASKSTLLTGGMQALGYGMQSGAYAQGFGRDFNPASDAEKAKVASAYGSVRKNFYDATKG